MIPLQSHASPSAVTGKANWPCTTFRALPSRLPSTGWTNGYAPPPDCNSACLPRAWTPIADGTRPHKCSLWLMSSGSLLRRFPPFSHKSSPPLCLYAHAMPRFQDWHIPPLHALHQNELKQHISWLLFSNIFHVFLFSLRTSMRIQIYLLFVTNPKQKKQ